MILKKRRTPAPGPKTNLKMLKKRLLLAENPQLKNERLHCQRTGKDLLQSLLKRDHKKAEDKKQVGKKANKSKDPVDNKDKKKEKSKSKDKKKTEKVSGKAKDVTKKEKASVGGQKKKVGKK